MNSGRAPEALRYPQLCSHCSHPTPGIPHPLAVNSGNSGCAPGALRVNSRCAPGCAPARSGTLPDDSATPNNSGTTPRHYPSLPEPCPPPIQSDTLSPVCPGWCGTTCHCLAVVISFAGKARQEVQERSSRESLTNQRIWRSLGSHWESMPFRDYPDWWEGGGGGGVTKL